MVVMLVGTRGAEAADGARPPVTRPRATSGDGGSEPKWDEQLTVTVGPKNAQIVGNDDKVLQAAVDYVARLGGGTVQVLPGTYRLRNSVFLASKVRIRGSGAETVLFKEPSHTTKLVANSDWYDQEVTFENPEGFRVGDGVCLQTKNPHNGAKVVLKRTLVARAGNRFKLDRALRENFWMRGKSTASALFPILNGENVSDVVIEDLTLDGNKAQNDELDGNYGGGVFLQDCSRVAIRRVTSRNNRGDGFSWQIAHDVVVENCHSHDNTNLGLHPGSGSQRPVMRNNRLERNNIGIFFCWGVRYGLAENNVLRGNHVGISIGHHDTHNVVRNNEISDSGRHGILFRDEQDKDFAGHHNLIEGNRILNSGVKDYGVGIALEAEVEGITLRKNHIIENRQPARRVGILIGPKVANLTLLENEIRGLAVEVQDQRTSGSK
jgi:hypothetical protein